MPIYKKDNITFFFSHIPKTGGSSVAEIFNRHIFERKLFSGVIEPCSLQHRHKTDQEVLDVLSNEKIDYMFTVVRHPVDRMISEYHMRRMDRDKTGPEDFHQFVDHVFTQYKIFPYINDNHIRPQCEFIHNGMDVFKFGDWENLMNKLNQYYNFGDFKFPHMNRSTELFTSSTYIKEEKKWEPSDKTMELIKQFYKNDFEYFK